MLSKEENELLTRVGPGSPMGELLRRFWMPALLEEELASPDCDPVRLKLLGEDLVAFRDTNGRIGILDAYCPHRLVHLYFGRNEDCGLRCVYHGWKFDVDGNCVDQPSEPPETNFAHKVKQTAYPTAVRGGVIWIYMGPKDRMPALPDFEWSYLPQRRRTATKRVQQCNWAQAVEGGIDSSHISYLHGATEEQHKRNAAAMNVAQRNKFNAMDRHPVFDVQSVPHGLLIGARRNADEANFYWRITQCLTPFYTMIPPVVPERDSSQAPYSGHAWVPIDDENTWTWSFSANPHADYTDEEIAWHGGANGMWGPIDENYFPKQNRENDYLLDRKLQREASFTGIRGIPNQDAAVQESMGPRMDRSREHLGQSDSAVIAWRRMVLKMMRDLEKGIEPAAASHGEWYNVRSCATLLSRDTDWQQGAAWLLAGGQIKSAAE
jgi:phenylpropionate dioxygenase-like ring-hydroxylating dioxygenase large terminal subunit